MQTNIHSGLRLVVKPKAKPPAPPGAGDKTTSQQYQVPQVQSMHHPLQTPQPASHEVQAQPQTQAFASASNQASAMEHDIAGQSAGSLLGVKRKLSPSSFGGFAEPQSMARVRQDPPIIQDAGLQHGPAEVSLNVSSNANPVGAKEMTEDQDPSLIGPYACRSVAQFEKIRRLGEGSYGTVYEARDKVTGDIVALKKLRLGSSQAGFHLTSLREVALLRTLSHPHIVKLKDVVVGRRPDLVFLAFEYCQTDLASLVDRHGRWFNQREIKTILLQLLSAIAYLHKRYVIHRDIKLSNLLIAKNGAIKLADFGLARKSGHPVEPMTPAVYTLWYRAPELLLRFDKYSTSADIWALGCVFAELVKQRPIMMGDTEVSQMHLVTELLGTPTTVIWPSLSERLDYLKYVSRRRQCCVKICDRAHVRAGRTQLSHPHPTLLSLLPCITFL